jgi:hypothetical protein
MARPPDPERLYEARRTAIRNRLLDEFRLPTDAVDVWIAAWEMEASKQRTASADWSVLGWRCGVDQGAPATPRSARTALTVKGVTARDPGPDPGG